MLTLSVYCAHIKTAGVYEFQESLNRHTFRRGHLEIHTPGGDIQRRITRSPVRHHKSLETPQISENIIVKIFTLRGMNTVQKIIRCHYSSNIGLPDSLLECRKIDFMERPLIHVRRHTMASPFLIICGKMLDSSHNALTLQSHDICNRYLTRKERVFTEIFKISSAKRRTIDIHTGTKKYMDSPGARILTKGYAHLVDKITVPSGCSSDSARI